MLSNKWYPMGSRKARYTLAFGPMIFDTSRVSNLSSCRVWSTLWTVLFARTKANLKWKISNLYDYMDWIRTKFMTYLRFEETKCVTGCGGVWLILARPKIGLSDANLAFMNCVVPIGFAAILNTFLSFTKFTYFHRNLKIRNFFKDV